MKRPRVGKKLTLESPMDETSTFEAYMLFRMAEREVVPTLVEEWPDTEYERILLAQYDKSLARE